MLYLMRNTLFGALGGVMSPRTPVPTTEPISLTESMQMVDEILSDTHMDRLDKIKRLEEILSAATSDIQSPGEDAVNSVSDEKFSLNSKGNSQCFCNCHTEGTDSVRSKSETKDDNDVACQTLSTGDIVITKIWFTEEEKEREKTLTSSPKKKKEPINI